MVVVVTLLLVSSASAVAEETVVASGRRLKRRLTSDVATLSLPPVSGMANRRSEGRCGLDDMPLKYSADRAPSKVDSRSSTMVGFEANERRHEEVEKP